MDSSRVLFTYESDQIFERSMMEYCQRFIWKDQNKTNVSSWHWDNWAVFSVLWKPVQWRRKWRTSLAYTCCTASTPSLKGESTSASRWILNAGWGNIMPGATKEGPREPAAEDHGTQLHNTRLRPRPSLPSMSMFRTWTRRFCCREMVLIIHGFPSDIAALTVSDPGSRRGRLGVSLVNIPSFFRQIIHPKIKWISLQSMNQLCNAF